MNVGDIIEPIPEKGLYTARRWSTGTWKFDSQHYAADNIIYARDPEGIAVAIYKEHWRVAAPTGPDRIEEMFT